MIDEIKKRTLIDISPQDVASSYVDSSFNVGSPPLSTITGSDVATFEDSVTFHPGASGARTTPGEAGFAYADTPEATVFIQKRQWVEDDWTYVTTSKERSGKIEELLLRIRLGNIITRKLDWLNDHEVFTKVNELTSEMNRRAFDLGGAQVTRYYTEDLDLSEQQVITQETKTDTVEEISIATTIAVNTQDSGEGGRLLIHGDSPGSGKILAAIHGPNTPGTPGVVIVKTTGQGSNPSKVQNVVNGPNSVDESAALLDYPASVKNNTQVLEQYPSAEWWEIDMKSIPANAFFPERNRDIVLKQMPDAQRAKASVTEMQNFIAANIASFNNGVGYVRRLPAGRTPPRQYAKSNSVDLIPVITGSTSTKKTTPGELNKRVFHNVFNGVIELSNIVSINTTITNSGNIGSAQLVLQNPNNNLCITEEDIDIALGENPFLDGIRNEYGESPNDIKTTDPITGQERTYKYYRGRYYTDRAYQLVTRQDLGAIGNFTNDADIGKLKQFIAELQRGIPVLQQFASSGGINADSVTFLQYQAPTNLPDIPAVKNIASKFEVIGISKGGTYDGVLTPTLSGLTGFQEGPSQSAAIDLAFVSKGPQVKKKIQQFAQAILISQREIENLINAGNLSITAQDDFQLLLIRNQLKKYLQNRTIFQPMDRVFIWITSPARSEHTDENGTPVSEEFTVGSVKAKRVQEIISLIQQLENVIQTIAAQLNKSIGLVFSSQSLAIINQELYDAGTSKKLTEILNNVTEAFSSQSAADALLETFIDAQNFVINPLGFESTLSTSKAKLPPVMESIIKTINNRVADLTVFIKDQKKIDLPTSTDTSVQGIDPSALFKTAYVGLTERQFQVFQGVITRISRSFSNGVFTVRLDCADNLYFLSRARYTEVPGLLQFVNQALPVLDDPIWRQRDAFVNGKLLLSENKEVPTESFFGKWKVGQLTLTAQVLPEKEGIESTQDAGQKKEATNTTNTHSKETIRRAYGREAQSENEPFEGSDPASIISILTCGVPFDLLTYVSNTLFKGSLIVSPALKGSPNTSHDGEALRVGPFESVRQQVAPLARKYGDFQPYLFSEVPITEEDRDNTNVATKMNLAIAMMSFYKSYIAARKSVLAADVEKDKQKTDTPGSPFKAITSENVDQVISDTSFPATVEEIQIAGAFKGAIDKKVLYIITSAVRLVTPEKVNSAMLIPFSADNFKIGSEDFSSAYQQAPDKNIFAMSTEETGLYNDISRAARERVTRGAAFKFLLESDPTKQNVSTPQSPSVEALVGASLKNPSAESLKGRRDAKLHPTNLLQCTKESIVSKVKPNFLVVSNEYVKNSTLIDYVRQIINPGGQFNDNEYATVLDRCVKSAKTIDWELYADTQGHIQFKPPTYNRTLLHHLINFNDVDILYAKTMKQILTDYGATDSLKAVPLSKYKQVFSRTKQSAKDSIKSHITGFGAVKLKVGVSSLFSLNSILGIGSPDPTTLLPLVVEKYFKDGRLQDITALIQAPPEAAVVISEKDNTLKSKIGQNLDSAKISSSVDSIVKDSPAKEGYQFTQSNDGILSTTGVDKAMQIVNEVLATYSQKLATYYKNSSEASDADNDDLAKAAADLIESYISLCIQCDKNMNAVRQAQAGVAKQIDAVLRALVNPDKVHVVTSAITLSEDWEETEPDFTRLNVMSAFGYEASQNQAGVEGANLHWAGSVDYDLWRIYGYKVQNQSLPFLQTGAQAAVYGDLLMARQYSKILRGTISVRGDSKYQLGDCVYIEDENIYYYITGINHQFSYGQGFSTTLTLEYGRRPGYYIPYPFDVLGKEFTRGANVLYTGPGGDKSTSDVDLNNLLDQAWQKDKKDRESGEYNS